MWVGGAPSRTRADVQSRRAHRTPSHPPRAPRYSPASQRSREQKRASRPAWWLGGGCRRPPSPAARRAETPRRRANVRQVERTPPTRPAPAPELDPAHAPRELAARWEAWVCRAREGREESSRPLHALSLLPSLLSTRRTAGWPAAAAAGCCQTCCPAAAAAASGASSWRRRRQSTTRSRGRASGRR